MFLNDGMHHARHAMVREMKDRGVASRGVLLAMSKVPRHLFVSEALHFNAYRDCSLPIGHGQTASKPSVVGRMVQALGLTGAEKVLEVGTGSGYATAILAELSAQVVSVERIKDLSLRARQILTKLRYGNVKVIHTGDFLDVDGDFDAVIVSAGSDRMPDGIFSKVRDGGVLVIPVGEGGDHCIKKYVRRSNDVIYEEEVGFASFVPLVTLPS